MDQSDTVVWRRGRLSNLQNPANTRLRQDTPFKSLGGSRGWEYSILHDDETIRMGRSSGNVLCFCAHARRLVGA